ncbi:MULTISPECIES: hypothetical protein [unclassified Nonomuraea]|uniref:hypothetical protein n=1 Tax=unclassified Nonomuraea TaxID=2593643 RepID=UPI0033CEFF16
MALAHAERLARGRYLKARPGVQLGGDGVELVAGVDRQIGAVGDYPKTPGRPVRLLI